MNATRNLQIGALVETPGPEAHVQIRNDLAIPSPSAGEVLIKLECTGVCHSDLHAILGHVPMSTNIPGHEGIGRVVEVGTGVSPDMLKRRVGVKWIYSYCNKCEICLEDPTYCPNMHNSGRDTPGTFQQYMVHPGQSLTVIPERLVMEQAAPLLCAGLTIYSAIIKASLRPGQWIVLPGAGGGLGHLGVQIAHKKGLRVIAIDTGEEKRKLCMQLGATQFLDFKTDDIATAVKNLTNGYGAHAAICLASSRAGYAQSLSLLRNLGTLVCIGLGADDIPISPFQTINKGLKIVGSSVGTEKEMSELLEMAVRGDIKPIIKVFEFEKLDEVLGLLERGEVSGRVVVRIPE